MGFLRNVSLLLCARVGGAANVAPHHLSSHSRVLSCHPLVYQSLNLATSWQQAIHALLELDGIVPMTEMECCYAMKVCRQSLWATQLIYSSVMPMLLPKPPSETRADGSLERRLPPPFAISWMMTTALHHRSLKLAWSVSQDMLPALRRSEKEAVVGSRGVQRREIAVRGIACASMVHLYAAQKEWERALGCFQSGHLVSPREVVKGDGYDWQPDTTPVGFLSSPQAVLQGIRACGRAGKWEHAVLLHQTFSSPVLAENPIAQTPTDQDKLLTALLLAVAPKSIDVAAAVFERQARAVERARAATPPWKRLAKSGGLGGSCDRTVVALARMAQLEVLDYNRRFVWWSKKGGATSVQTSASAPHLWRKALAMYNSLESMSSRKLVATAMLSLMYNHVMIPCFGKGQNHDVGGSAASLASVTSANLDRPRGHKYGAHPRRLIIPPFSLFKQWAPLLHSLGEAYFKAFPLPVLMKPQLQTFLASAVASGKRIVVVDTNVVLSVVFDGKGKAYIFESLVKAESTQFIIPFCVIREVITYFRVKKWRGGTGLERRNLWHRLQCLVKNGNLDSMTENGGVCGQWTILPPAQEAPSKGLLDLLPMEFFESPLDPDRFVICTTMYLEFLLAVPKLAPGTNELSKFYGRFIGGYGVNSILNPTPNTSLPAPQVTLLTRDKHMHKLAQSFGLRSIRLSKKATI